jgi:hypothetical protein
MSTSFPQQSLFDFEPSFGALSGTSSSQPLPTPIETLSISDLMKNPHFQSIYNKYQEMVNQVLQAAQLQQTLWQEKQNLWQENCHLSAKVRALQVTHSQTK